MSESVEHGIHGVSPEDITGFTTRVLDPKATDWKKLRPEMRELIRLCFSGRSVGGLPLMEAMQPRFTTVLLDDADHRLIGFSIAGPDLNAPGIANIDFTAVHPDFQGRGLVGKLMDTMEKTLLDRGFYQITRDALIKDGYADAIGRHYGKRVLYSEDRDHRRHFRINLVKPKE